MPVSRNEQQEQDGVLFHVRRHSRLLPFGRAHDLRPVEGPSATRGRGCHTECLWGLVGVAFQSQEAAGLPVKGRFGAYEREVRWVSGRGIKLVTE
jgi:hypothetical protein